MWPARAAARIDRPGPATAGVPPARHPRRAPLRPTIGGADPQHPPREGVPVPIADEPLETTAAEDAVAERIGANQRRLAADPEPSHDLIVCGAGTADMTRRSRVTAATLVLAAGLFGPAAACAHVKWFAPYIVGAPPRPVGATLRDGWFWLGIALALAFFVGARLARPVWGRLDDYVRAIVAAFFVAVFPVGGIYLTPDLKSPAEWVPWVQLLIAAAVFWRATMPLAGAGIVALWLLALRDCDLFHLFDYLALGLGIAAYLELAALPEERWRAHRFEALRWALAAALMWSSLEKIAYPAWFHPLVVEKPYLTFGLPRDAFIPMAGVAEFTLGCGLLWTPLVRRLSAAALLAIFPSAVCPFGRIEIIGHGLIMAMLLAVAADQSRHPLPLAALKAPLWNIPEGWARCRAA